MKKFIGIAIIALGALMLIASYFVGDLVDANWFTTSSLLLIIAGIITHISVTKYTK